MTSADGLAKSIITLLGPDLFSGIRDSRATGDHDLRVQRGAIRVRGLDQVVQGQRRVLPDRPEHAHRTRPGRHVLQTGRQTGERKVRGEFLG